ncbi:MAG: aminodeoxychorismate/anthranilate synthase component II [Candidatus Micrarchaeota archaeon]
MILVIDNYDSFTYNLVQALGALGEKLEIRRNDQITIKQIEEIKPDRIVISPGPCTPNEAGISIEVIQRLGNRIPILGVCLGHQAIGQAFGGRIIRTIPVHGKTSEIKHDGNTIFKGLKTPFTATRYHSLIIEKETIPDCLEISATDSKNNIIMGVRHKEFPIEGVQFHPESFLTLEGDKLLKNFLDLR